MTGSHDNPAQVTAQALAAKGDTEMQQSRTLQGELTVTLFADQIRWMDACGLAIWKTPGSSTVYMHDHAEFAHDVCVANLKDVLDAVGVSDVDEVGDDDYAELYIWI